MADRSVNINIKYNVNTAEVLKAQRASEAAQKATDDLRKASESYAKAATAANKEVAQSTRALQKDFNDLYSSVRLVLTGGIAKELVSVSLEMAKLSGQIDGVSRAFSRLPNATLLLENLRQSTHGTVTDLALMQKALQASNFRIPLQNLGKLFEFAAVKAQQTGQEVNHLVDYIVSGIGYRSIKRLDDLGFTANRVKEALGGVSLQAASMGQVMDAVTKLMDEDLQKTGGYIVTTATQVEQIETKWTKLKTTVSSILTTPAVLTFYQNVLDLLNRGAEVLGGTADASAQKADAVKEATLIKQRLLTKEILKDKQKTYDVIQQEANTLQQNIGRNNDELKTLREKRASITDSGRMMSMVEAKQVKDINQQIEYYQYKNEVIKNTIGILGEYNKSIELGTEEEKEQLGIIERKRQEIEKLRDELDASQDKRDSGPTGRLVVAIKKAEEELNILLGKTKEKTKEAGKEVNDYLAYLSDLEMFNVKEMLDERVKARKEALDQEVRDEKEAQKEKDRIAKEAAEAQKQLRKQISSLAKDILVDQTNSFLQTEIDGYTNRINQLNDFYDNQIELAGDNENAKKEIKKRSEREITKLEHERADKEKRASEASILVNTALGVIKAFADYGWPAGIIPAAFIAAEGASQYAIASRARYYAKGEIDIKGGTPGKDSIPAYLMPGESIMTTKQTREAFGILTDVRAGKLNDKILKQLVVSGGVSQAFDDSRMVDAISKNRAPDVVRIASDVYEVKKDRDGNRKFIRSKSI